MKASIGRRALVGLAVVILAAAVAGGLHLWGPRHTPTGQPPLAMLSRESLPSLVHAFNEADDKHRIIAMLSPT